MAHPFPDWKIFFRDQEQFFPPKLAVFGGSRHFPKIEGPFPKIEGQDFERIWLAAHHDHSSTKELAFQKLRARPSIFGKGPSPKNRSIKGAKTPQKCTNFFHSSLRYTIFTFCKKMGQNGHSSPQQWSEQFTAAYMGFPPPTR